MNLSIRLSRLQLKHCFDFFTRSRNDQLLWVNWQIRCTFHLTYIADHRSTLPRWMTQADRRSWTSVIARKSLYLLSFFVVAHICMTFTVSKSHRLAINRHFLTQTEATQNDVFTKWYRQFYRVRSHNFPASATEKHPGMPLTQFSFCGSPVVILSVILPKKRRRISTYS